MKSVFTKRKVKNQRLELGISMKNQRRIKLDKMQALMIQKSVNEKEMYFKMKLGKKMISYINFRGR